LGIEIEIPRSVKEMVSSLYLPLVNPYCSEAAKRVVKLLLLGLMLKWLAKSFLSKGNPALS